jgi:hypothetical protein
MKAKFTICRSLNPAWMRAAPIISPPNPAALDLSSHSYPAELTLS